MSLLSTVYTTTARIEQRMSALGLTNMTDHDEDGTRDTDVVEDAINWATVELDQYLWKYSPSDLASDELVQMWATDLAVFRSFTNRGNPAPLSIQNEVDRIWSMLPLYADGQRQLRVSNHKQAMRPVISNLRVDRRFRRRVVRVVQETSPETTTTRRRDFAPEIHGDDYS